MSVESTIRRSNITPPDTRGKKGRDAHIPTQKGDRAHAVVPARPKTPHEQIPAKNWLMRVLYGWCGRRQPEAASTQADQVSARAEGGNGAETLRHDDDEGMSWPELLRMKFACRGICADRRWARFCEECGGEETVPGGPCNLLVKCTRCSGRMRWMTPLHVQRKKKEAEGIARHKIFEVRSKRIAPLEISNATSAAVDAEEARAKRARHY